MIYTTETLGFTVTLTTDYFDIANNLKNQFNNENIAQQVYLNTLAVCAVDYYFNCMSIATNIDNSSIFNPIAQTLSNVADLEITNLGKVECRPVLPTETTCHVPPETWEDSLGYFAVIIDESAREAIIGGFLPPVSSLEMKEIIPLTDFQNLDYFIDYLYELELKEESLIETITTKVNQLNEILKTNLLSWENFIQPLKELPQQSHSLYDLVSEASDVFERLTGVSLNGGLAFNEMADGVENIEEDEEDKAGMQKQEIHEILTELMIELRKC